MGLQVCQTRENKVPESPKLANMATMFPEVGPSDSRKWSICVFFVLFFSVDFISAESVPINIQVRYVHPHLPDFYGKCR